jgi:hypothetical protein
MVVLAKYTLPSIADWNDQCVKLPANPEVSIIDGLVSRGRVLPSPGHVEYRLPACVLDRLIEKPNALVHALGVLNRKRALLLQDNEVEATITDRFLRFAGIPVTPKRRAAGADQAVL